MSQLRIWPAHWFEFYFMANVPRLRFPDSATPGEPKQRGCNA